MSLVISTEQIDAFWARVEKLDSGCWEWTGARIGKGYGELRINGKFHYAHRLAFELANGGIPDGLWVLHDCDNPPCANPAHLYAGTVVDNANDCVSRGRNYVPTLEQIRSGAKLTVERVLDIRNWKPGCGMTRAQLAIKHGVSLACIKAVRSGRNWKPETLAMDARQPRLSPSAPSSTVLAAGKLAVSTAVRKAA